MFLVAGIGAAGLAVLVLVAMPRDITADLVVLVVISAILAWVLLMSGLQFWRLARKGGSNEGRPGHVQ
jgi:hypothetical protein